MSIEAFYLYVYLTIARKRIPGFSLLCDCVLLLYDLWCPLRWSIQGNQTDGTEAAYSAIFLDL